VKTAPVLRKKPPSPLRTYSHLAGERRMPSEYELVSTNLLYYPALGGFEVKTPLSAFYADHQRTSPLSCANWERFADPRETTYTRYVSLARSREAHVDGTLETIERTDYDARHAAEWVKTLERAWVPLRFPLHGLQMLAAYVGQMAPSGRIAICAAFQAGDQIRRIQRIAYRTVQLRRHLGPAGARFGLDARATWETDAAWQPLREAIERALVTWDFGEAFVATNLVLGPVVDQLFFVHLAKATEHAGDPLLGALSASFLLDGDWHRDWSRALVRMAIADRAGNREVLRGFLRAWTPRAEAAAAALAPVFGARGVKETCAEVHRVLVEIDHALGAEEPS
jgi:toluene monooxygenase system protein E